MQEIKSRDLRLFASLWALIFILIALFPLLHGGQIRIWPLPAAGFSILTGLMCPSRLKRPYSVWMRLARVIGLVNTTVLMLLLFYLVFTPVAFILRITGRDLLHKKTDKNTATCWIKRDSQPNSMKLQF